MDFVQRELKRCHENLWKKEFSESSAMYVNIFDTPKITVTFGGFQAIRADGKNNAIADQHRMDGNQLFKQEKWLDAIDKYNKSLRYAVYGSETMALAYANRSSCYLHLGKYDNCWIDIMSAIKSNYPAHLMPKLEQRRATCEAKGDKQAVTKQLLHLSYPNNATFPAMADCLEIRQNTEFGRHIVAKCDIPAGKTIFIEPSYVAASDYRNGDVCSACQRVESHLMPCECCTVAMFCSVDCVSRSRAYHAQECGYIFHDATFCPIPQYLIRSIFIAIHACGGVDELMAFVERVRGEPKGIPTSINEPLDQYRHFLQLHTKDKEGRSENATRRAQSYHIITTVTGMKRSFDTLAKQRFLMHLIVMHDMIISDNGFTGPGRSEDCLHTMGLIASLFNHQCASNLFNCNIEGKEVAITIRPVKQGEQLFLAYTKTHDRQEVFYTHGFWCKCSKCVPVDMPSSALHAMNDDLIAIERIVEFIDKDVTRWKDLKEKCVNFLNVYGRLPFNSSFECVIRVYMKCLEFEYVQ